MTRRLVPFLVRLYPRSWRERYGDEFAIVCNELLDKHDTTPFRLLTGALTSAGLERLRTFRGRLPALRPFRQLRTRAALSWIGTIAIALTASTGIRAYAAESYSVPSLSMSPTLQIGDRIVVNKLSGTIHRGDIVVFRRTSEDHDATYNDLVKRIVALPGETISSQGNRILIDGKAISQPWLPRLVGVCAEQSAGITPTTVPANTYYVMGDCRGDSSDSRVWGTVPAGNVVGKVAAVVWRHDHPWIHWF